MKRKVLFITLLYLGLSMICRAQSDNAPLVGTWTVRSVELRQTIDLSVSIKLFTNSGSAVFGVTQCPRTITFTTDSIILAYTDSQERGSYRVQGNTIQVDFPTHPCEYTWLTGSNGDLQLNQTVNYVINDQTSHKAKDECKFTCRK
ncbi:MAG: hypothetical protein LBB84_00610 [Tannerellaceae bacterium]|nr:hypothetical protein [Tannerellaceae bacterium]